MAKSGSDNALADGFDDRDLDLLQRMLLLYAAPQLVKDGDIPMAAPVKVAVVGMRQIIARATGDEKRLFASLTMKGRGDDKIRRALEWCVRDAVRKGTTGSGPDSLAFFCCNVWRIAKGAPVIVDGVAVEAEAEPSGDDDD